ncbi:MAG: dUTP diphosphatase [Treponema sp.]|nr:dUTP diphosphatase [Treponema sp.]MCL2237004.1 dUTP diphosphatase [Treponema sp.]
MNEVLLKILKTHSDVTLPRYESEYAAGMDIRAYVENDTVIPPLARAKIPTGLRLEIPAGYEGQVRPRSGLAIKQGLTVLNSPGTIDSDYRGELEIILVNLGESDVTIKNGDRIAQLVIAPVVRAEIAEAQTLCASKRASCGFGSTGSV